VAHPAPFDHSKIMVVDDAWCMLGSGNWDPRSLRLNFEFNVEAYDPLLAAELNDLIDQKIATASPSPWPMWTAAHCPSACATAWPGCLRRICDAGRRSDDTEVVPPGFAPELQSVRRGTLRRARPSVTASITS
jgi:hypothetical protein